MTGNIPSFPYLIQIKEPLQAIHLTEEIGNLGIQIEPNAHNLAAFNALENPQIFVESQDNPIEILQDPNEGIRQDFGVATANEEQPCVFQIVYPQELNLSPAYSIKRGRPKKKKPEEQSRDEVTQALQKPEAVAKPPKSARTRSGRLVKLPKYIERDFKKIEISTDEQDVQISDFKRFEEKENSTTVEFSELQTKKRTISAQFRCPKCSKAYLGKNKMIQHLKKYPDHGPLPEGYQEFNFDVWNYLFDITQKCKSGQRGLKFCEELSNLLHNVQLLKSALFKTVTDSKNCVHIDKVLGNAIGLSPGKYKFDENELYKDVTVLKLITNSEFFKPNVNKNFSDNAVSKNKDLENDEKLNNVEFNKSKKFKQDSSLSDTHLNEDLIVNDKISCEIDNVPCHSLVGDINEDKKDGNIYTYDGKSVAESSIASEKEVESVVENFDKKMDEDSRISLHTDLLTDNLLLHSLPNSRNSVDELILSGVDNSSNLLDNSTSSDEVMNVDQFVNERFKKIIEPDIELGNASLNLDLPGLELFQFHTS